MGKLRVSGLMLAALCVLGAPTAEANEGIYLSGYDTIQLQRMNAGVASPRNASWLILNPAGIGALNDHYGDPWPTKRLDLNLYTVFTDVEFNPGGLIGNFAQGTLDGDGTFFIPSNGVVWPVAERHTLGVGVYTLSGAGIEYEGPRNVIGFLRNSDRQLKYQHTRLVLGYAYEFADEWYFGVTAQGSFNRFRTDHHTLQLLQTDGSNDPDIQFGFGFGLGVHKKWDRWAFGASYLSRHWVGAFDDYDDLLYYAVDLPQSVQIGAAYEIIDDKLEIVADVRWIDWNDIALFGRPVREGGFDWKDQWGIKLGIEYRAMQDRLTLRAGYSYSNTPISRDHVFMVALVPVNTEQHIAAGFTYELMEGHEVSLTGLYAFRKHLEDTGTGLFDGDFFSPFAKSSDITTSAYAVSLGYTIKWGGGG